MIESIAGIIILISIVASIFALGIELYEKAFEEMHREDK